MNTNIPSTKNFRLMPFTPEKDWQDQTPYQLAIQWEQAAAFQLQPGEAIVGTGMITNFEAELVGKLHAGEFPLNVWILRHNDYDTGRPNIEVHLRVVVNGSTFFTILKDDTITEGKVVDFVERRHYVRLEDEAGFCWGLQRSTRTHYDQLSVISMAPHTPDIVVAPGVRTAVLFEQCLGLSKTISRWLCENIAALREPVSTPQAEALTQLFEAPMFWLLDNNKGYQQLYDRARGDLTVPLTELDGAEAFMRDLRRTVLKGNRIATPEQRLLHDRLARTFKEIRKERNNPDKRAIALSSLLGLHTKWTNAVAEHREAFFKAASTVAPSYMIRWVNDDKVEYWVQPLQGWSLRNVLGKGRFEDTALIANRYSTLEQAQSAFEQALLTGGKTEGVVQIVARGLKVVDLKVLGPQSDSQ